MQDALELDIYRANSCELHKPHVLVRITRMRVSDRLDWIRIAYRKRENRKRENRKRGTGNGETRQIVGDVIAITCMSKLGSHRR